jgi:hypothetical protein
MGANNADFEMFHVSRPEFRDSIAKKGLKAQTVWNDQSGEEKGPGVWVSHEPEPDYGTDVWGIKNRPTGRQVPGYFGRQRDEMVHETDMDDEGHEFIPHSVPVSDIKRVGHIHRTPEGHPEVHWHPAEECPNK